MTNPLSLDQFEELLRTVWKLAEPARFDGFTIIPEGPPHPEIRAGATLISGGRKVRVVGDPYHNPLLDKWVFQYRNLEEPEVVA